MPDGQYIGFERSIHRSPNEKRPSAMLGLSVQLTTCRGVRLRYLFLEFVSIAFRRLGRWVRSG